MLVGSGTDGLDPEPYIAESLRGVARVHNRRHPDEPIVANELFDVTVATRTHRTDDEFNRWLRRCIELDRL